MKALDFLPPVVSALAGGSHKPKELLPYLEFIFISELVFKTGIVSANVYGMKVLSSGNLQTSGIKTDWWLVVFIVAATGENKPTGLVSIFLSFAWESNSFKVSGLLSFFLFYGPKVFCFKEIAGDKVELKPFKFLEETLQDRKRLRKKVRE